MFSGVGVGARGTGESNACAGEARRGRAMGAGTRGRYPWMSQDKNLAPPENVFSTFFRQKIENVWSQKIFRPKVFGFFSTKIFSTNFFSSTYSDPKFSKDSKNHT